MNYACDFDDYDSVPQLSAGRKYFFLPPFDLADKSKFVVDK